MINERKAPTYRRAHFSIGMQKVASLTLTLTLLMMVPTPAAPSGSTPRKSPDFTINEAPGKQILLSSFQGKVVVVEFLFLRSLHCLRVAQTLNRLYADLGPKGFQPVGIVFGPGADLQGVAYLAQDFKLNFPFGYADPGDVDAYLERESKEILNIPQIVVIDRGGVIRAQSGAKGGNPALEDENSLRTLLDSLLKEDTPLSRPNRPLAPSQQKPASSSKKHTVSASEFSSASPKIVRENLV